MKLSLDFFLPDRGISDVLKTLFCGQMHDIIRIYNISIRIIIL